MTTLYEKLGGVQAALKAPKGQRNTFANYNYRSAEDILEAVKPLLAKEHLVLVLSDSIEQEGERCYVKATARLIDTETGEFVENSALAREPLTKRGMDEPQVTGTCSSYARKYAMNGLFAIDDAKDVRDIWEPILKEYHAKLLDEKIAQQDSDAGASNYLDLYKDSCNVIGATCTANQRDGDGLGPYDVAIIDGASKATPSERLLPRRRARRPRRSGRTAAGTRRRSS